MKFKIDRRFDLKIKNMKIPIAAVSVLLLIQAMSGAMSLRMLINLTAIQIILAGIFIALIVSFPLDVLINTVNLIKESFLGEIDYGDTIHKIYNLTIKIKRNGLLSIQEEITTEENTFLRDAMILLNDYKRPESIEDILEHDIESRYMNLYQSHSVLKMVAHISPALGLIGTLVGMIGLLANIGQPQEIMNHMGTALVSTLYGSLIANLVAVPLMARLKEHMDKRVLQYRIIKEGTLLIAKDDTARNIFDKMNVMLNEEKRLTYPRMHEQERNLNLNEFKI